MGGDDKCHGKSLIDHESLLNTCGTLTVSCLLPSTFRRRFSTLCMEHVNRNSVSVVQCTPTTHLSFLRRPRTRREGEVPVAGLQGDNDPRSADESQKPILNPCAPPSYQRP